MAPTLPCSFFAMGHCSKGSACTFSHDIEPKGAVCQFFLQGNCRFGTYCQLSHVKPKKQTQSTSKLKTSTAVKPVQIKSQKIIVNKYQNETELGLCPFHITEKCNANACKYIHGLQCPVCKKNVLDPRKPSTHDEHVISCTKNKEQESRSKEKECVVCFEIVKEKKDPRFGLLACEHCVCLTCIRSWRDISSVDTSKTCPICRTVTRFVTPSQVWPATEHEKQVMVEDYTQKLKHVDSNGVAQQVRFISNQNFEDQGITVMGNLSLSDYI